MTVTSKTAERLIRMAFEVEQLSARLNAAGFDREALGLRSAMDELRYAGDKVLDAIESKKSKKAA